MFTSNVVFDQDIMPRLSLLDKARVIGQLQAGVHQNLVSQNFGISQSTVSRLRQKYRETGEVKDRPRSGRPRVTTPVEDRYIRVLALRNRRLTARVIQGRIAGQHGRRISDQTIRNRLHAANLKARKPAKKPAMTALQRATRLRWCRQHRTWTQQMWRRVLFSDESRFCLRKVDGRARVWRRRGERFANCCIDRVTAYGGGSVMVWGGISTAGKTDLVIINGNLNGQRYRDEILDPVAIPYIQGIGGILQDDNARPHRARIINDHLQQRAIQRIEWPACSPDLNPIEHLWDQLGRAVRSRVTDATTLRDLRQLLVDEWNAIPQQRIQRLISSMRRRCQAVAASYGGSTRY